MNAAGMSSSRHVRGNRLRAFLVLAIATSLVVPVAISWACGPQRAVQLDRVSYTPGQTVHVTGNGFTPDAVVTIKLNGEPVASATVSSIGAISASFSAPTAAGTHVVTTEGVDAKGQQLAGTGNAVTLTVVAPAPSAGSGGPAGGGSTPGTTPQRPGATAPAAPGRTSGGTSGRGRGGNSRSVSGGEQLRRAAARKAPANAGINSTEGVITTRGTTSFAGSVPRATRLAVAARAGGSRRDAGGKAAGRPSQRSASADLWSGVASGKNPSLMPGSGSAPSPGGAGSATLAFALLGAGALALLGLGLAEAKRRRKAPAGLSS